MRNIIIVLLMYILFLFMIGCRLSETETQVPNELAVEISSISLETDVPNEPVVEIPSMTTETPEPETMETLFNSEKRDLMDIPFPPKQSIPENFADLYDEIEADLDAYLAFLPDAIGETPVFSAELLYANGNMGYHLLEPGVLDLAIMMLDRFQTLGIQGVGVQISYPLLMPGFNRSDEFLGFFKEVEQEIHQREMVMFVETGPVFPEAEFSGEFGESVDYTDLTIERYFEEKQLMLEIIAREIQPDYLSLSNEPSTEMMLTGLNFSAQQYYDFITATLARLQTYEGTQYGAGSGSWEDPEYSAHLMSQPMLDFINIHIYPVGQDGVLLERAQEIARQASEAGKAVLIGESWLYKAGHQEFGGSLGNDYVEFFSRDLYSFWQPLDAKFMLALTRMAQLEGIDMVSFFWSRYLMGYLDYEDVPSTASTLERSQLSIWIARDGMMAGNFSPLGNYLAELIKSSWR